MVKYPIFHRQSHRITIWMQNLCKMSQIINICWDISAKSEGLTDQITLANLPDPKYDPTVLCSSVIASFLLGEKNRSELNETDTQRKRKCRQTRDRRSCGGLLFAKSPILLQWSGHKLTDWPLIHIHIKWASKYLIREDFRTETSKLILGKQADGQLCFCCRQTPPQVNP